MKWNRIPWFTAVAIVKSPGIHVLWGDDDVLRYLDEDDNVVMRGRLLDFGWAYEVLAGNEHA